VEPILEGILVTDVDLAPPGELVLVNEGELASATSTQFAERLGKAIADRHPLIVIDLSRTSFIDSSGLGALVAGLKQARREGTRLVLAALQEQAALIFRVTNAHKLFEIYPSVERALESPEA
jgi:anti-sigma B factor antagonist